MRRRFSRAAAPVGKPPVGRTRSTPGRTRTCNPWFRRPVLYPIELRTRGRFRLAPSRSAKEAPLRAGAADPPDSNAAGWLAGSHARATQEKGSEFAKPPRSFESGREQRFGTRRGRATISKGPLVASGSVQGNDPRQNSKPPSANDLRARKRGLCRGSARTGPPTKVVLSPTAHRSVAGSVSGAT